MNISNLDGNDAFQAIFDDVSLFHENAAKVSFLSQVCVFGVGLLGNLISLTVWVKGQNTRKLACSMCFTFLSASDSFVCYTN
jgi:hypothetical protein